MSYLRSLFWALRLLFGLLVLCGAVGGLGADLEGVNDHPAGERAMSLAAAFTRTILHLSWNYPFGVLIGWVVVGSTHWLFTHNHVASLKREYADKRRSPKSRGGKASTGQRKSGKLRKGKGRRQR